MSAGICLPNPLPDRAAGNSLALHGPGEFQCARESDPNPLAAAIRGVRLLLERWVSETPKHCLQPFPLLRRLHTAQVPGVPMASRPLSCFCAEIKTRRCLQAGHYR